MNTDTFLLIKEGWKDKPMTNTDLLKLIDSCLAEKDPIKAIGMALGDGGPDTVVGKMTLPKDRGGRGFCFFLRIYEGPTETLYQTWFYRCGSEKQKGAEGRSITNNLLKSTCKAAKAALKGG